MKTENSIQLNFPPCHLRIRRRDDKEYVWDPLRKRYLLLTEEEWVRRHVIGYLTDTLGYTPTSIVQEYPVSVNGQPQRADIVVLDNSLSPYIVVECKAPDIEPDFSVKAQAYRYNSVLKAKYIMITNGITTRIFETADAIDYTAVDYFQR